MSETAKVFKGYRVAQKAQRAALHKEFQKLSDKEVDRLLRKAGVINEKCQFTSHYR
jgi:hypothetical protein